MLARVLPALMPGAIEVVRLRDNTTLPIPSNAEPDGDGVLVSSGVTAELVTGTAGSDKAVVGAALLDPFSWSGRTLDALGQHDV
jgi:hypothetical protein